MNEHNNEASKQLLLEFLDFFRYKIENDLLTMGEVESLAKAISERVLLLGTIDDFAQANAFTEADSPMTDGHILQEPLAW